MATKSPIGASAESTAHAETIWLSCEPGGVPKAYHGRDVEITKSTPNWQTSARRYTYQWESWGCVASKAASTMTGPATYQALMTSGTARSGCASRLMYRGMSASSNPATTHAGTRPSGTRNSIGTRTSCVGTADPAPTSN